MHMPPCGLELSAGELESLSPRGLTLGGVQMPKDAAVRGSGNLSANKRGIPFTLFDGSKGAGSAAELEEGAIGRHVPGEAWPVLEVHVPGCARLVLEEA